MEIEKKSAILRQPSGWSPRPGKAQRCPVRAEALPERGEAPAGLARRCPVRADGDWEI